MKFLVDNQRGILAAYVNSWSLMVLSLINLIFFSGTVILSM
ncbi:hypothetical protein ACJIZ3_017123 [Penstemon smallii]|uniref:Uncharacterized protein n=1 Tax=Penstemon smallii TaxID=265156 RepID=A0ABD3SUM6_9LAMI